MAAGGNHRGPTTVDKHQEGVAFAPDTMREDWRVPHRPRPTYQWLCQHAHRMQVSIGTRRAGARDAWQSGIRILCYHRIADDQDTLAVSPDVFRAQMETMLALQVSPIALSTAPSLLDTGAVGRYICVTFDDGYRDNLENALPVLQELGIPATIFIPTAAVDGKASLYWYETQPRLLDWSDLQRLSEHDLISIGAHTRLHLALPSVPDEVAWSEIAGSKHDLERQLGREVVSFAYPAGMFSDRDVRMVREAGYRVAVTTEPGLNDPCRPHHVLRRMVIDRRDNLKMFEGKITGLLDQPWGLDTARALFRR